MKLPALSRRKFLFGASLTALTAVTPKLSVAWFPRGLSSFGFNGGITQTGSGSVAAGTSWPFINLMLTAQNFAYIIPPAAPAPPQPVTESDGNGYVNSIVAGTGGVVANLAAFYPLSVYSGVYVMDWIGNGTLGIPGNGVNSGWIPNTGYSVSNLTSTTGSGRFEFTLQNTATANASFLKIAALGSPYISQIRIYRKDHETLLNGGQILAPDFLSLMKFAKPSTFRSLGWIGSSANGTNDSNIALWAHRKPRDFYSYRAQQWVASAYAGVASQSGNTLTLTSGTAPLSDKLLQHLMAAAAPANVGQKSVSVTNSSVTGQPAQIGLTNHQTVVGDIWTFATGGGAIPSPFVAGQVYYVATVVDANNVTLSATKGGTAISTTAAGSSVTVGLWPSLSIDNGVTNYILANQYYPYASNAFTGFGGITANKVLTVVFDQTTSTFALGSGVNNTGLLNGVPPEVFVDCCAEIGASPHIVAPYLALETGASVDGVTDFMTQCATYIKNTYSWMNPLFEPSNEVGFGGAAFLSSFYAPGASFARWGNISDATLQLYGKWASTLGQAIAPIYGNDWTKFRVMASIQTQPAWSGLSSQDNRFKSTAYVNNNHGGNTAYAAYNWVNRGCLNTYYSPARRFQCQDAIDGFNWTVTNAGNPTGQDTVAEAYVNSLNSGNVPYTAAYLTQIQTNFKTYLQGLPAGNRIGGMVCYEGGYSPDYLVLQTGATIGLPTTNQNYEDWAVYILNATQTNPCVLTVATYTQNGEAGGFYSATSNPAVVGMAVNALSVTGGMSAINQPSSVTATFTASSANIVLSSGTYSVGQNICFSTMGQNIEGGAVALPSAIVQAKPYWIVSVSGTTIQISATQGGTPITLTDAGTPNGSYPFYAQLCYIITAVSGNQITINYDASAQPAFTSTIFTASISGGNMSVTAVSSGTLASGQTICDYTASGAQVVEGGTKTTNNGGSGGTGTYTINQLQNVASQQMAVANGQLEFSFSQHMSNNIRWAGKATTALGTMNTLISNNYYGLASAGFVMENFSNFLYFGGGNVWMVLDPNQYAPATPQWSSIAALN